MPWLGLHLIIHQLGHIRLREPEGSDWVDIKVVSKRPAKNYSIDATS